MATPEFDAKVEEMLLEFLNYKILSPSEVVKTKDSEQFRYTGDPVLNSYQDCMQIFVNLISFIKSNPEFLMLAKSMKTASEEEKQKIKINIDKVFEGTRRIFNKYLAEIKKKLRLYKKNYYFGRTDVEKKKAYKAIYWVSSNIIRKHIRDIWNIIKKGGEELIEKYITKHNRVKLYSITNAKKNKGLINKKLPKTEDENLLFQIPDDWGTLKENIQFEYSVKNLINEATLTGNLYKIRDAYKNLSGGNKFVYIPALAKTAGLTEAEIKNALNYLHKKGVAVFSGNNLAVVKPEDKIYAYMVNDLPCMLVDLSKYVF